MADDIRSKARDILGNIAVHTDINSDGATAALFTKYTGGVLHKTLTDAWAAGKNLTTCNAFVGWFGGQLGAPEYLGRFDLEAYLKKNKKGYAWVSAKDGDQPKYGDIFRPVSFHMGISLDTVGNMWNTIESGQGGSLAGHDIIRRKSRPYDASKMQGWLDIVLYFGGPDAYTSPIPIPSWLVGWWSVSRLGGTAYYYFGSDGQVKTSRVQPASASAPAPINPDQTGSAICNAANYISVVWSAAGTSEMFNGASAANDGAMTGLVNGSSPIKAAKLQ